MKTRNHIYYFSMKVFMILLIVIGCEKEKPNTPQNEYNPSLRFLEDFQNEYKVVQDSLNYVLSVIDTVTNEQLLDISIKSFNEEHYKLQFLIDKMADKRENNTYTQTEQEELIELYTEAQEYLSQINSKEREIEEIKNNMIIYISINQLKKYYYIFLDMALDNDYKLGFVDNIKDAYSKLLNAPTRKELLFYENCHLCEQSELFVANIDSISEWYDDYLDLVDTTNYLQTKYNENPIFIKEPEQRTYILALSSVYKTLKSNSVALNLSHYLKYNLETLYQQISNLQFSLVWEKVVPNPEVISRTSATAFKINNILYFGCGDNGGTLSDFYSLDINSNIITELTPFPGGPQKRLISFAIDDIGYVGGGFDSFSLGFWEYNPNTDSWVQKEDLPAHPEHGAIGFSIQDKGYIITPTRDENLNPTGGDLYEYSKETDTWVLKAKYPGGTTYPTYCVISENFYVGISNGEKTFWKYSQNDDSWTRLSDFPGTAWQLSNSFAIGSNIFVIAGWPCNNEVWKYSTTQNNWQRYEVDFPGSTRHNTITFSQNDLGYIGFGSTGCGCTCPTNEIWKFDYIEF